MWLLGRGQDFNDTHVYACVYGQYTHGLLFQKSRLFVGYVPFARYENGECYDAGIVGKSFYLFIDEEASSLVLVVVFS